ncbi:MAG: hypothetical protein FJ096_15290 [Deltaproteobacteria bacterium]|nr:hypothetical protein [Deltaproteobacteria bacterium]
MRMTALLAWCGTFGVACNPLGRLGLLPSLPESRAVADAVCDPQTCVNLPRVVEPGAPLSLWSVRFAGGKMKLPSDPSLDWFGLVVAGELDVEGCGTLGRYHAYRIPAGGAKLSGHADVVFGVVSDQPLDGRETTSAPSEPGPPSRCERVDLAALPDVRWGSGTSHARLAFRTGRAYFGLLYSEPGVNVPAHTNAREWEMVHVLRGSGEVLAADSLGPLVTGVSHGFAPGVRHGFNSNGTAPTIAVQMYTPPGPEQRFVELAADD